MMPLKRQCVLILVMIMAFLFIPFQDNQTIEGNYVVMLSETLDPMTYDTYEKSYGLNVLSSSDYGFSTYLVPKTHQSLFEGIGFVQNGLSEITRPPFLPPTETDPFIGDQYALPMMSIPEAWTQTTGSADVLIAIIDTGIDFDHEEFVNRISPESYNSRTKEAWIPGDPNFGQVIDDDNGHGTMVAGVIGATKDNNKGIAGIVQLSQLLIIKANNEDNPSTEEDESKQFNDASIIEGIHYAVDQGADIINLSLGGSYANPLTKAAVDRAHEAGIIIVGASGNDGNTTKYYPASFPGVISVAALDETKTVAPYSNYNDAVDLAAPGSNIVTTILDNAYGQASGTSLAAPQVTAVIGLMKAHFPDFTRDELMTQIMASTEDLGTPGYDFYYGYGLLNADQALQVEYITVTFEVNGGTPISPLEVIKDRAFITPEPTKEGHSFLGWYLDQALTLPFVSGVDILSSNATLYAAYEINTYQITFVTSGDPITPLIVNYQEIPDLPVSTKVGHTFVGWYLDGAYTTPYTDTPIIDNLLFYARFEPNLYQVTYYIEGLIDEVVDVYYGTSFTPKTPETELPFLGWYLSMSFVNLYTGGTITSDIDLYARLDNGTYTVTYFASDLTTVLLYEEVFINSMVTPPEAPIKPSSASFEYVFISWSDTSDDVIEDMLIYPLYEAIYQPMSVGLNKGVDTISSFDDWTDGGLDITDPALSYETSISPEDQGRYLVTYQIIYESEVIDTRYRMVYVIDKPTLTITLNPDVTTILQGDIYVDAGATSNLGSVEATGTVDTKTPGVYVITYEVTLGSAHVKKSKYVYVLTSDELYQSRTIAYYKKEDEVGRI